MLISESTYNDFITGQIDSFYETGYAALLMYATRILGSDFNFLAEDCVQDAIFEAYQKRSSLPNCSKLKSYLYRCVHNNAVSVLRKNVSRHNYITSQTFLSDTYDMHNAIIEQETFDLLYEAIEALPDELHCIFEMCYIQGMKNNEVAETLGISVGTVKKRKTNLINTLRGTLNVSQMVILLALVVRG